VTPTKDIYNCETLEIDAIYRLESVMDHYNESMYEMNVAYDECKLIISVLIASKESSTPLERNMPGDISDATIDMRAEETNVHTKNVTFVTETEIDIPSFKF